MAKEKSYVIVLFLSLLICLSSQVGVAESKRYPQVPHPYPIRVPNSGCANEFPASPPISTPPVTTAPSSISPKGKGP
ncbi:hypothetical protein ISN45_Aa06g008560 [Arabidopsis thaliana x Arabidopsis arenosa]|uniref:Transmembrane protein n=1 Tax=Arabidopsis thaliana x Arabidopsis arenosa TaxID=1240361 RepID=A0A8T1YV61_9BRAS|nr:hypothetical protein ISN45_Aa06g008560 [Arabidopsis thaliana x Arabidopsis arenosa]